MVEGLDYWMDDTAVRKAELLGMPLIDLSDVELAHAAQAARAAAYRAEQHAAKQNASSIKETFQTSMKRYRLRADKFEVQDSRATFRYQGGRVIPAKGELVPFADLLEELRELLHEDAEAMGCTARYAVLPPVTPRNDKEGSNWPFWSTNEIVNGWRRECLEV